MVIKINNTKSHKLAVRNLWYIGREKLKWQERFLIYDRNWEVLHKDWIHWFREEIKQYDWFYRVVVSPDPSKQLDLQALQALTQKTILEIEKQAKAEIQCCYAIHNNTDVLHSHILIGWFQEQLKMSKREFLRMKENVTKQENILSQQKEQERER